MEGINIFSGESGLGGALTNPTELARRKGTLERGYPVRFAGKLWVDAESAYHALKGSGASENDALMIEIIAAKFQDHPQLKLEVQDRGGAGFLAQCNHLTGARSESAQRWEGCGMQSRFIRNLVTAYERACGCERTEGQQHLLF